MALSLARHNPTVVQLSQELQHPCRRSFRFEGSVFFFGFLLGTDTCPLLCIPIHFKRTDIREDANTQKVISYKYLSKSICTVVEEFCQSDFCL